MLPFSRSSRYAKRGRRQIAVSERPHRRNKELSMNRKVPPDIGLRLGTFSFFHGSLASASAPALRPGQRRWRRESARGFLVAGPALCGPLTVDEDVLPPDVVLAPAVVVLHVRVAVLQLRQRGQRRVRRRQQLRRRRRRPERLDGLRVLVLHQVESRRSATHSLSVHSSRRGRGGHAGRAIAAACSARQADAQSHACCLPPAHRLPLRRPRASRAGLSCLSLARPPPASSTSSARGIVFNYSDIIRCAITLDAITDYWSRRMLCVHTSARVVCCL